MIVYLKCILKLKRRNERLKKQGLTEKFILTILKQNKNFRGFVTSGILSLYWSIGFTYSQGFRIKVIHFQNNKETRIM